MNKLVILLVFLLAACGKQAVTTPSVMDFVRDEKLSKSARDQCDAALISALTGKEVAGNTHPSKEFCDNFSASRGWLVRATQFGGCASNDATCIEAYYSREASKVGVSPARK